MEGPKERLSKGGGALRGGALKRGGSNERGLNGGFLKRGSPKEGCKGGSKVNIEPALG